MHTSIKDCYIRLLGESYRLHTNDTSFFFNSCCNVITILDHKPSSVWILKTPNKKALSLFFITGVSREVLFSEILHPSCMIYTVT